jgi:hypothetical protein
MGFLDRMFGKKTESDPSPIPPQTKKPSGEEIQRILEKPWSQVTQEDRKILCTPYLGVKISGSVNSKGEYLDKFPQKIKREVPEEMIELAKTWVISPEGCPIKYHKILDGQMVIASEMFEISAGLYEGFKADGPRLFGVHELDDDCTCFLVTGIVKKGFVATRAVPRLWSIEDEWDDDEEQDLNTFEEVPEVPTIPEIYLSQNQIILENFREIKTLTKKQKESRKIAASGAEKNFDILCDWVPRYITAADKAGFHQREKILGVLNRETTYVYTLFKNLGRVDGYELSMMQTLEKLTKYYDEVLYGEYPHHSKDVKKIIESTSRRKKN